MISVCIATYNGASYIEEQLKSILGQLDVDDEVVISDDSSSDDTLSIIKRIGDDRIKIYAHKQRKAKFTIDYATANFENALLHSQGDIIFLADQDDKWLDGKVKTMLEALRAHDIVMSDCCVANQFLQVTEPSYYSSYRKFRNSIISNFLKPSFLGCCMAFHRHVLNRVLPFPSYGVGHDYWIGLVGLRFYDFYFLDTPLMLYRRHSENVTDGGKKNHTSFLFKLRYRLYVLWAMRRLIKR